MDTPTKIKMMDIGDDGKGTEVGTLSWDGKKWSIDSKQDISCISAMIDAGMLYGGKKLSWTDQDLYLPLTRSRTTMFRFSPV